MMIDMMLVCVLYFYGGRSSKGCGLAHVFMTGRLQRQEIRGLLARVSSLGENITHDIAGDLFWSKFEFNGRMFTFSGDTIEVAECNISRVAR
jgi:hypothetical protein